MPLNEKPKRILWDKTHYLYVEKTGPFMTTAPAAWQELHQHRQQISSLSTVESYAALYQIEPLMVYRAGVFLAEKPMQIPTGLQYAEFEGGPYLGFELLGAYSQLPEACGRVFAIINHMSIRLRKSFYIENYVNDPQITAEENLITEILVPIE